MRLLVYTCVFGGYDRVYPPIQPEQGVEYVIITEDESLRVPGWQTKVVAIDNFASPTTANRYYKMLVHRELSEFDASLYVDGNIRILGKISEFFAPFLASGAALGLYPHGDRDSIASEIEACVQMGKVVDPLLLQAELSEYVTKGFRDEQGLTENGVVLKNHRVLDLDEAMEMWWDLYARHETRDQVSLPFVRWKTGVSCYYHKTNYRNPNQYFAIYPHHGALGLWAFYAHLSARSHDSLVHRILFNVLLFARRGASLLRSKKISKNL